MSKKMDRIHQKAAKLLKPPKKKKKKPETQQMLQNTSEQSTEQLTLQSNALCVYLQ